MWWDGSKSSTDEDFTQPTLVPPTTVPTPPADPVPLFVPNFKEQFQQQQSMIEHIKESLRENDAQLHEADKQREIFASKLTQIKSRSRKVDTEMSQTNDRLSPKGKMHELKKRLEENKVKFEENAEKDRSETLKIESIVEELRNKVQKQDVTINELQKIAPNTNNSSKSNTLPRRTKPDNQLKSKYTQTFGGEDLRIQELEAEIIDLKDTLREKESLVLARTQAVTLLTKDLAQKGKSAVDDLEETRSEMRALQNNFVIIENQLKSELLEKDNRLSDLDEKITRLETEKLELSEKINDNSKDHLVEKLTKELEDSNKLLIRMKIEHKNKVKALSKQEDKQSLLSKVDELEKEKDLLQVKITELEEEKGTISDLNARIKDLEHVNSLNVEYQQEVERLKQSYEDMSIINDNLNTRIVNLISDHENEIQYLSSEHNRKIQALEMEIKGLINANQSQQQEILILHSQISEKHALSDPFDVNSFKQQIDQLVEEKQELIERLKNLSTVSSTESLGFEKIEIPSIEAVNHLNEQLIKEKELALETANQLQKHVLTLEKDILQLEESCERLRKENIDFVHLLSEEKVLRTRAEDLLLNLQESIKELDKRVEYFEQSNVFERLEYANVCLTGKDTEIFKLQNDLQNLEEKFSRIDELNRLQNVQAQDNFEHLQKQNQDLRQSQETLNTKLQETGSKLKKVASTLKKKVDSEKELKNVNKSLEDKIEDLLAQLNREKNSYEDSVKQYSENFEHVGKQLEIECENNKQLNEQLQSLKDQLLVEINLKVECARDLELLRLNFDEQEKEKKNMINEIEKLKDANRKYEEDVNYLQDQLNLLENQLRIKENELFELQAKFNEDSNISNKQIQDKETIWRECEENLKRLLNNEKQQRQSEKENFLLQLMDLEEKILIEKEEKERILEDKLTIGKTLEDLDIAYNKLKENERIRNDKELKLEQMLSSISESKEVLQNEIEKYKTLLKESEENSRKLQIFYTEASEAFEELQMRMARIEADKKQLQNNVEHLNQTIADLNMTLTKFEEENTLLNDQINILTQENENLKGGKKKKVSFKTDEMDYIKELKDQVALYETRLVQANEESDSLRQELSVKRGVFEGEVADLEALSWDDGWGADAHLEEIHLKQQTVVPERVSQLEEELKSAIAEKQTAQEELNILQTKYSKVISKLKSQKTIIDKLNADLTSLKSKQSESDLNDAIIDELRSQLLTFETSESKLKSDIENNCKKFNSLNIEHERVLQMKLQQEKDISDLRVLINQLQKEHQNDAEVSIPEDNKELVNTIESLEWRISELTEALEEANEKLTKVKDMDYQLANTISEKETLQALLINQQAEEGLLKEQLNILTNKYNELETGYNESKLEIERLLNEEKYENDDKLTLENLLKEKLAEIEELKKEIEEKTRDIAGLTNLLETYKKQNLELEINLNQSQEEIHELKILHNDLIKRRNELEEIETKLAISLKENEELKQELVNKSSEIEKLDEIITNEYKIQMDLLIQEKNEFEKSIRDLKDYNNELKNELEKKVMDNNLEQTIANLQEEKVHLKELINGKNIEIANLTKSLEEFRLEIEQFGNFQDQIKDLQSSPDKIPPSDDKSTNLDDSNETELLRSSLQSDLDTALNLLHQRDVRCDELTFELMQLLEERDALQLRLSTALRLNEELRGKLFNESLNQSKHSASSTQSPHHLEEKLTELHAVGYNRDKTIQDETLQRHQQQVTLLTRISETEGRERDVRGKSSPKVMHI